MSEVNYEMLGRYTEAKERAERLIHERQRALWDLKSLINGDHAPEDVKKIDWEKARELLSRAERLDGDLRGAWDAANMAAEATGKTTLGYRR
jgi:septal ring factor EnvC (AmiA/AmiB activator)